MANAPAISGSTQDPQSYDYHALAPMVKALEAATEAFLGEFHHAASAVPFELSPDQQRNLRSMLPPSCRHETNIRPAGAHAAEGYGATDYDEQYLLMIEEARAEFTASIILTDVGIIEVIRVIRSPIHESASFSKPSEATLKDLEAQLRDFVAWKPIEHRYFEPRPRQISKLIRFGRPTENVHLTGVLKGVFGDRYASLAEPFGFRGHRAPDPVFAASQGLARECLWWLNPCHFSCTGLICNST
jgi:hypothetical protein